MGISRVREAKNASELIHGEFTNVPNLEFWGLD